MPTSQSLDLTEVQKRRVTKNGTARHRLLVFNFVCKFCLYCL